MTRLSRSSVAAVLALCATASAQITIPGSVAPSERDSKPLLTNSPVTTKGTPRGPSRIQVVVDAAALGAGTISLQGLDLHVTNTTTQNFAALTMDLTVSAGATTVRPATMTPSASRNRTGAMTVLRSGPFAAPAVAAGTADATLAVSFPQPFSFDTTNGNLLLEIEANVPQSAEYAPIATARFDLASVRTFGSAGAVSPGVPLDPTLSQVRLDPATGTTIHAHGIHSLVPVPVVVLFGSSDTTTASGLSLPIALSPLGMSGSLLVSPDVVVPGTTVAMQVACALPRIHVPGVTFEVPVSSSNVGLTYYTQPVALTGSGSGHATAGEATATTILAGAPAASQALWTHPDEDLGRFIGPEATEAFSFSAPILGLHMDVTPPK